FPAGSVVAFFQSLGLTFGRDQNAFTSFDQTTYQLTLPGGGREMLTKGMLFMADVATRLSLAPAEIDAERQIILEEKRAGAGARGTRSWRSSRRSPRSAGGCPSAPNRRSGRSGPRTSASTTRAGTCRAT